MQINSELNRLSDAVSKITSSLELLEHSIYRMRLNALVGINNMVQAQSSASRSVSDATNDKRMGDAQNTLKESETIDAFKDIGKLGAAAKNAVGLMNNIPKGLSKVPAALGLGGTIAAGAEGFTDMATKEHTTVAEKVSIASKILTDAAGMAIATLEFGLPGLVVYTAVRLITTYVSIAKENERKQEQYEAIQKKQSERAMNTFVMTESNADEYGHNIASVQPQRTHHWKMKVNPANEVIRKYGQNAYDLTIPIPIQAADQLNPQRYLSPMIKHDSKSDELPREYSYFEKTFSLRNRLLDSGVTGGNEAFVQSVIKAREQAKEYDLIHHTNTLARTEFAIKESAYDLLDRANGARLVSDSRPISRRRSGAPGNEGEKTVVINLNRAMIEHFVVNSTGLKEGVNHLKDQVEQALLEVLNAANSIN